MLAWLYLAILLCSFLHVFLERGEDKLDDDDEEEFDSVSSGGCGGVAGEILRKQLENENPVWDNVFDAMTMFREEKQQDIKQKSADIKAFDEQLQDLKIKTEKSAVPDYAEIERFFKEQIEASKWGNYSNFTQVKELQCGETDDDDAAANPEEVKMMNRMVEDEDEVEQAIKTAICTNFGAANEKVKNLMDTCRDVTGCDELCAEVGGTTCPEGGADLNKMMKLEKDIENLRVELLASEAAKTACDSSKVDLESVQKAFEESRGKINDCKTAQRQALSKKRAAVSAMMEANTTVSKVRADLEGIEEELKNCKEHHKRLQTELEKLRNTSLAEECAEVLWQVKETAGSLQHINENISAVEELKREVEKTLMWMHSFYDAFVIEPFRKLQFPTVLTEWDSLTKSIDSLSNFCTHGGGKLLESLCKIGESEHIKKDIKEAVQHKTGAIKSVLEEVEHTTKLFDHEGQAAHEPDGGQLPADVELAVGKGKFHDILNTVSTHAADLNFFKNYLSKWKSDGEFDRIAKDLSAQREQIDIKYRELQEQGEDCTRRLKERLEQQDKTEKEILEIAGECGKTEQDREKRKSHVEQLMKDLHAKEQALLDARKRHEEAEQELNVAKVNHKAHHEGIKESVRNSENSGAEDDTSSFFDLTTNEMASEIHPVS